MVDEADKLILFELMQDCRQPLSKIAKTVKLSQQRVHYRIKKLEQDGIIKKYTINLNYPKLGYSRHSLYLDLRSINAEEVDKYLKHITDINEVSCCYMLHDVSEWKMYISVWTKTIERYDEIQTKIISKFHKHIKNYLSFQSIKSYTYFSARILNPKKETKCDIKGNPENIELKPLDWKIIDKLRKKSNMAILDLAHELKVDTNTIKRRIDFLVKENIIERFYIIADINKLGLREYTFISRVSPSQHNEIDKLIKYAQTDPRFGIIIKAVGYVNLYYAFYAKNNDELKEITHKVDKILGKTAIQTYKIEVDNMIS
jgi:DNA-binding Lrp family transcriptional regulator